MTRAYTLSTWTEAKDEIIRQKWGDPSCTTPQIAALVDESPCATERRAKKVLKLGPKACPSPWDAEKEERLRELWKDPENGTRRLAEEFGVSRNSIITKARKMGLPSRDVPPGPKSVKAKREAKPKAPAEPKLALVAPVDLKPVRAKAAWTPLPGSTPITLLQLCEHSCRWPVDLAGATEQHFCGEHAEESYCAAHIAAEAQRSAAQYPRKPLTPSALSRSLRRYAA